MPRHRTLSNRVCVLVSGGVDSAALVAHFLKKGRTVYPIYVFSGYRWERAELYWLRKLLRAMSTPRLKSLTCLQSPVREFFRKSHWAFAGKVVPGARSADSAVYLPGRNILLLSAAAVYAAQNGIDTIALGTLRGNPFDDASPAFFALLQKALASGLGRPIRIAAPFRRLTKREVVRRAGALPWGLTFSCLSPAGHRPCGNCNKCEERRRALKEISSRRSGL